LIFRAPASGSQVKLSALKQGGSQRANPNPSNPQSETEYFFFFFFVFVLKLVLFE
jgi:hypothetical protein